MKKKEIERESGLCESQRRHCLREKGRVRVSERGRERESR